MGGIESRYYAEADFSADAEKEKNKSLAQRLIEMVKKMTRRWEEKKANAEEESKAARKTRLSKEMQNLAKNRPSPDEVYQEAQVNLHEAVKDKKLPQEVKKWNEPIPVQAETKRRLEDKITRKRQENPESEMVKILDKHKPNDERNAHLAEKLLDINEQKIKAQDEAEMKKMMEVAEDLARVSVTTEYTSEPATEARGILRDIKRNYTADLPENNPLKGDLNELVLVASPQIEAGNYDQTAWIDAIDETKLDPYPEAKKHIQWVKEHKDKDLNNPAFQREFGKRFERALDTLEKDPNADAIRDQVLEWQGKYIEQTGNRTRQGEILPRDVEGWKEKAEELFDRIEKNRDDIRIDFNRTVSEVKEKIISNMRLSGDKKIREEADELEIRLSTIVSAHNGFLAFDTIGFGQDSIRKLEELSKSTPTGSFFKEIGQDIAGVEHPIADSMQYIEVVIPQMIQDKHGEALGFADIGSDKLGFSKGNDLVIDKDTGEIIGGSLWNRLDAFLKEKFKDQLGADDKQEVRDRIIRRSIRFSMLTGRLPEIIARNSHIPHGPAQYQENPFRSVLQIFMPTVFGLNKWDQLSHHEKETIYAAWAGKMKGGSLEDRMRQGEININSFMPYSDAFSHGWRDRLYVKALDNEKYGGKWSEFGLWMRYFYEGDNKAGKSAMLDKILSRDTHILPLARLFLGDNELNQITGGKFEKFDRKISTALLTKLSIQMRTGKLNITDSDCSTGYERDMLKVISQNKSTIDTVMGYLKDRKQQILDGKVVINGKKMSLNHLQLKTLSVEDMPLDILHDDPELAAEQGLIGRLLTGETSLGYGIFQSWSELVTHPENLSLENLQKILDTGKQWYGQEGVSERFVDLAVPALQNLYQARWHDRIIPNWFYEMFPGFPRPNEISEVRDFIPSMYGQQWKEKIDELIKTGRLDRHIGERALDILKATPSHLLPPKLTMIVLGIILATAVLGVSQGVKDLDGNGGGSGGGGGHH